MGTIDKLVEASQEFNKELADITATISKTTQNILQLLSEQHTLKQQHSAAIAYIELLQAQIDLDDDTVPIPPAAEPGTIAKPILLFNEPQENQGWGDAILFPAEQTLSVLKDTVIVCGGRAGLINHKNIPFTIDWDNLTFVQGPYPAGWGASMGKVLGRIANCTFVGLGRREWTKSQNFTDGHPTYFKPAGDVIFEGNKFLDCGGNSQFADRPWENEVVDSFRLDIRKNIWSNCSWNATGHGGGGSSNLAVYSGTIGGTDVLIEDCVWHNTITWVDVEHAKKNAAARGCLTVWNETWYPPQKAIKKGFAPDDRQFFKTVKVKNCIVRTTEMDRVPFSFEGARDIVIENLTVDFIGLPEGLIKPFIKIDDKSDNPQQAKHIKIDPIDAPGYMRIKGVDIPLVDGYSWTEEGYTPL